MSIAPQLFSAAQIAAALSRSKRGVLKALSSVTPADQLIQRGGKTDVWRIEQLPESWRDSLAEVAQRRGYRDSAHLLATPAAPWQPQIDGVAVTLSDLAEHCRADALRLQRALLPSLARLTGERPVPAAEALAKGLAEYRAVFGHDVSEGHWRRLINRTVDRDAGAGGFSRIELFLADKLARRPQTAPGYVAAGMHLESLRRALSAVGRPAKPTHAEQVFIWVQAFDEMQWLLDDGTAPKAAVRAVFAALAGSGVHLAKSPDALKKSFTRKLERFQKGGSKPSALRDGRSIQRAGVQLELPVEDHNLLVARAVECGGRISQAWRGAQESGELSPETAGRYIANPANKSYVPGAVRDRIRFDVAALEDIHHGPRRAKLNGPFIPRDYSDITPGDWSQADDCTLPVAYCDDTPEGLRAMRGQFILMVDVKTTFILGFALHSERNYNAQIIRTLIARVHDAHGLPRKGFYFEGGLWKRSRLIKGRAADEVSLEETELGLREFAQFRHAKLPRAKVIEGVLGILQNAIKPMPGYLGRNEMIEKFERIQKQLLQASTGKLSPDSFLLRKEQWVEVLGGVCERYNNEAQGGRLKGMSPYEAYENGFDERNPLDRLPPSCRYLLANHRRKEKVSKNGIRIVFAGEPHYFRSADTGRMIGKEVLVWHDFEGRPESVTITDLQRRNPIEVPRVEALPSMTATAEQLGVANAQAAAHLSHARTLYRIIQPHFMRNRFRSVIGVDAATRELGEQIAAGRAEVKAEEAERQNITRRVASLERETGVRFTSSHRNPARKLAGLEMLRRADELERQESEGMSL